VECPACGHDNRAGAGFCGGCGVELQGQCPNCKAPTAPGANFCDRCGTPLQGSASFVPSPPADRHDPPTKNRTSQAERRQVTTMFCDLVDSSALSTRLDPEEVRDLLAAYQQACANVVARFEGHIARYVGDGLLICFGYPRAHEDDAERAVRSALEIIGAIQDLDANITRSDVTLAVRIGIATGLVVVGDIGSGERREVMAIVGETPNLAARVQNLAKPNSVIISAGTRRLVDGLFLFEDLGLQQLKGLTEPQAAFRVCEESGVSSRLEASATRGLTPLVGREEEIALLIKLWNDAKEGDAGVVLLSGEAGIGKSRVARDFHECLQEDSYSRISYYCSPYYQNSAFYPVIDQFERSLGFQAVDTPQQKIDKLNTFLGTLGLSSVELTPLLASLLSLPTAESDPTSALTPQTLKRKTLEAMLIVVKAMALQRPVLIVAEDLHWSDPSTLEWLSLMLELLRSARLLLLLTFRTEFEPPWIGQAHVSALTLSRLSRSESIAIASKVTPGKALPEEVLDQIIAKTDGVPLFVEELTKAVVESVPLEDKGDRYALTGPLTPFEIPNSLKDSLMARLDRQAPIKEVAQLAATLGRKFSHELLAAVAPLLPDELDAALSELLEASLIYRTSLPPDVTYEFKHALVRDAAYESLLKSKREQYHRQIALTLEKQFPEVAKTQPELLAHHATEAGHAEQAIMYWKQAGERAIQRSANLEAISHFRKGLDLNQTLPKSAASGHEELTLHILLGAPLIATKGWASPEVAQVYARARELCRQVGKIRQLFPALRGVWGFHLMRGELQTARDLGDELISVANDFEDSALGLEAHLASGMALFWRGEFRRAQVQLERVTSLYDSRKHCAHAVIYGTDPGAAQLFYLARTLWHLGFPDAAKRKADEALALAKRLGHPHTLAWSMAFAASLHLFRGDWSAARSQAEETISLCTEHGFPFWLAWGMVLRGSALGAQGDLARGIAEIQQGLDAYRATGAAVARPYFLTLLAEVYARAEQAEPGLTILADAVEEAEAQDNRCSESEMHRLMGELTLRVSEDSKQEAEHCFQKAIGVAQRQRAKSAELRAAVSLAGLWQRDNRADRARKLLAPIYDSFSEGLDTVDLQNANTLLSEVA